MRERERETETETERDRERQRETERETEKERETERETDALTHTCREWSDSERMPRDAWQPGTASTQVDKADFEGDSEVSRHSCPSCR